MPPLPGPARRPQPVPAGSPGTNTVFRRPRSARPATSAPRSSAASSSDHRHGESETAIHVVSGHPEFVFLDDSEGGAEEVRLRTSPGDRIFVPPFVPHREENPDPAEEAVVVVARSTQEAIVVNLPRLYAPEAGDA
ncbi:cupin domain-containing protein [Streptomyces caelestis]|uniref:cupin domain-containing protein n=1 Tax=Streptomyces caelestis TaxID=36816 RepID=UPI00364C653F